MSGRRFRSCLCCGDYRRGTSGSSSPTKILDIKSRASMLKTNLEVAGSVLSVSDLVEALRFKGTSSRGGRLPMDMLRALTARVVDFPRSFNVARLLVGLVWGPRRGPAKSVSSPPATFPSSLEYSDEASALPSGEEGGTEAKSSRALTMASIISDLVRVSAFSARSVKSYRRTRSLLRSLFS